jgi:acid stress-induced BolA-like protein IbaG/YrbA
MRLFMPIIHWWIALITELLADHKRHRMKAGLATTRQDNALHAMSLMSFALLRAGDLYKSRRVA